MKKMYVLLAMLTATANLNAQTIISYGKNTVSRDEFLKAYNKNKPTVTNKEQSIRDYITLYSNFKLKVKAAQDLRLDTLSQIKYDVENFRNQVAENYLSDEKGMERLQDEAFERSSKDLHVVHIFAPVNPANDSSKARAGINEAYAQLKGGNTDYAAMAKELSGKYSTLRSSDLGFITAFSVPYEYENIIYALKPGQFSAPYRSKNGWHIFKATEERSNPGKWRVAQILFSFPPAADAATKELISKKADSVYGLLNGGLSFGAAAKLFSDDKLTYLSDGEMAEFSTGKYSDAFFNEVLKLKKDDETGRPFETAYGFHIIKRLGVTAAVTDKTDANYQAELKQKVLQDARVNAPKEKFAQDILVKTGLKRTALVSDADLGRFADSLMVFPSDEKTLAFPISKKTVASFKDGTKVPGSDWLKFVKDYKTNFQQYKGESNTELWKKFMSYTAVNYYKKNLERYNEDFAFQVKEFKEGNMLFEIMERNVWGKAANDNAGLKKHYEANKQKYKWEESANILIFNAASVKDAQDAMDALKAGKDWRRVAEEMSEKVQADSGRYEIAQIGETNVKATPNTFGNINANKDGSAVFVKYLELFPAGQQRSFDDARGLVINDYQGVLEEKWLEELKKKYPVKINEVVVKEIIK
ncbi:MAG: peptidylprolyl isomerase [Ferruginibacter sp.]